MAEGEALVPTTTTTAAIVAASGVERLLAKVRAHWQAKSLIQRVRRLLPHDPSSACQRLLNAAIQDLREKIVIAGIDIARQAANAYKLPPVQRPEDILDDYSVLNILDLTYRMGLLTRPEWKRMRRAYEIRRDLEHEDDEYEAGVEDCVYIFSACIEIVLSREPVEMLRVVEVKEQIQAPQHVTPSPDLIRDFERAPEPRQQEIADFLVAIALDQAQPDITRQNAVEMLRAMEPFVRDPVKIELAKRLGEKVKRAPFDLAQMKVAAAGGFLPYLKQRQVEEFFSGFQRKLQGIGYGWKNHPAHNDILDDLEDVGGLVACPPEPRRAIVLWMTLCYLGEPGGYGFYGRGRSVFYSDSAISPIRRMFKAAGSAVRADLESAGTDPRVQAARRNTHIARRFDELLDLTEPRG